MDFFTYPLTDTKYETDLCIDIDHELCHYSSHYEQTYQHQHDFSDIMSMPSLCFHDMIKPEEGDCLQDEILASNSFINSFQQQVKMPQHHPSLQKCISTVQIEIMPTKTDEMMISTPENFDIDIYFTKPEVNKNIEQPLKNTVPSMNIKSKRIAKKVTEAKPIKKATESIKKIMRLFRKYIKDSESYDSKHVEVYFTEKRFRFSQETFKQNQGIFEEMTCCIKGPKTTHGNAQLAKEVGILNKVFNQSPSKRNLTQFFQNQIIQDLWWGNECTSSETSFFNSKLLNNTIAQLDSEILLKVYNFFQDIQTPHPKEILPQF